ncbi:MAG: AMP-binding protein [Aminobacterium sp.]|jgi:long-chain acyl-CoA synthetase|uniref:AMP-binding protein n=1 Tax=Aminobacterium sp. TaxID=1872491 RepID=UPI002A25FFED|nr:AMP-binding protein [Aminobacterium sp.]MDD2206004.1 AMP-binding protein [Aminobacterium sp.]MDD3425873.1 AMP-binding protein [Aminobacterium sp.]MDD3707181.1 AMP-binding protein [Aminobacterium sp.]MDD4227839.1 AMP-binding protein [Aminobacterium sp.]MDD4550721.1 AMP-binding protein [Aminobacterium sp.]
MTEMVFRLENRIMNRLQKDWNQPVLWWNDEWWTGRKLADLAAVCKDNLEKGGFGKGHRLAVMMPNSPMVLALSLAVWSLGGAIVPINTRAGVPTSMGILKLVDPFAVILGTEMDDLQQALTDNGFPWYISPLDSSLGSLEGRPSQRGDEELAVIFATSGTTGLPKAVPLSHKNLLHNALTVFKELTELREGDIFLNVLPNFHSFGFTVAGLMPLLCGMLQTILPSFLPPHRTLEAISHSKTNVLLVVPTMLTFLLSSIDHGAPKPEGLKVVISGGDRLNMQLDSRVKEYLGVEVLEGYGLTECSPVVCVNRSYEERKLGTVGPFISGYQWRLINESGEDVTSAGEGVLWVKGNSVTSQYFRDPDKSADRFQEGWFNTGDYVRVDSDGYVQILDRVTDIIIVGGFNVYPQEVEAILQTHPAIEQAIVVGIPHQVNGEVPKAYVKKKQGESLTPREVIDFCKKHLAHYKVPRSVEFIDAFPLSSTGKVLRRMLKKEAASNV